MLSHAIEVLGWTLLHFVWQGTAVGVLAAMMLLALRRRSANARYLTAVSALGLMLLLPIGTIAWIEHAPPVGDVSPIVTMKSTLEIPRTRDDGTPEIDEPPIKVERIGIDFENPPPADAVPLIPLSEADQTPLKELSDRRSAFDAESFLKPFIPWAVAVWLIGVGVLSLRLFGGWLRVQRLRCQAVQPASESWQALLRRLAERLRVTRPVQLVESALVEVPTVIGWLRPIILLPATAMTGLTTEQLEALLAHELAHVRRHDYLVNLLQTVVETLLFYHPAVWWLSHRIRVEREHCCDDLAVQVCGDRLTYAKALVTLEELRAPNFGLAMSSRGGSLLTRVARLLGPTEQQRCPAGWFAGMLSLVLLTMAGALGAGLLTPPDKPTAGLPNNTQSTPSKSVDTNEETSGPTQRRGQETRAERVPIEVVEEVDPEKRVIARVNGVTIHEADVTSRYFEALVREQSRQTPEQLRKTIDQLIRRDLPVVIERKLLVAEAMKLFDAKQRQEAEEFIKRNLAEQVVAMMKDSGVTNREELQNLLRQQGTSLERLESEYKERLYAQQFLAKKLESTKTPEETEKLRSQLLLQLWQQAEVKSEYLPHRGEIRWVDRPNERVWINLGEADGIRRGSVFRVVSVPPNNDPAQPIVIKGKIEVIRIIDQNTSEARIVESDNDGPAKGNEVIPAFFPDPKANGVDLRLLFPFRKLDEDKGRFVGQVRLKTEKPLPDLSNVKLPPGKILDESLVFSKEGGLANVFVYLRKPTFKIEEPTDAAEPKPFVLTSSGGRFLPHLALVRVGQPVEFANADKSPLNFRTAPIKNAPQNRLVPPEERVTVPAFNVAENLPVQVGSNVYPWMSAWLLPLDHPFAAVTDAHGRFSINGLPPGEHEFRVWHERIGYLNKKLVITIQSGEETRTELEYEPSRFGLSDDALRAWSLPLIDVEKLAVPRPKVPPVGTTPEVSQRDPGVENANRRFRQELTKLTEVSFIDTPLSDVMTYLGDYHNIAVTFDASATERVKNLETVTVTLTMTGEDLATVLRRVLHPVRLSYFVADGKLQIATADEVKRRGHPVPESLEDILAKLQKADATVPWEGFLLGSGLDAAGAPVTNVANLEKLTKLLAHADVVVQRHAAVALSWFGKKAAPAQLALEKLTASDVRAVRRAAWQTLLSIGREDLSTWPFFLAAWIEGDDVVNDDWLHILKQFDPKVFDKLTKLFPTSSVGIRRALASSIRANGRSELTESLALLAFDDEDQTVRHNALRSSRHDLTDAMRVSLRKRLRDESSPCRVIAADRLLSTSDGRAAALDVLLSEFARDDSSQKGAILSIFANHGRSHQGNPVRDFLLRRSVSPNEAERLAARQALKVVPEETQTAGVLKHVDLLFEIRKNEPKLSPAQRVQALDEEMQHILTQNNPSEEQRARVNHRVAHQFANWDIRQHFAMVWKYAEAGLRLDVDPARQASLHSLLGSAALVNSETKTFAEQRRNAAMFWLTGYREVASLKLPKTASELPVVEKLGDLSGESAEQRAVREQQHAAQVEARQQAESIRQMIEHRHQLARLLVETYQRAPADAIELRMLATEALKEKSLVEALLAEGAIPFGARKPATTN